MGIALTTPMLSTTNHLKGKIVMNENIILNSHVNYLINRLLLSDLTPVLKKRYAYALGSIRTLFHFGILERENYFIYMRLLRYSFHCKYRELMRPLRE